MAGTASCQSARANGDGGQAHHHAAAERLRHHHAVPGRQHPAPRGLRGARQHRHAGQRGELRDARGGLAARAARTVRRDRDVVAAGQQVEQRPQALGAAARRRTEHHVEREAADHGADELAVAVPADQHVDAVAACALGDWRASIHSIGIIGRRSCQKATTTGAPAACGAICSLPSSDQRVVRSAKAR